MYKSVAFGYSAKIRRCVSSVHPVWGMKVSFEPDATRSRMIRDALKALTKRSFHSRCRHLFTTNASSSTLLARDLRLRIFGINFEKLQL